MKIGSINGALEDTRSREAGGGLAMAGSDLQALFFLTGWPEKERNMGQKEMEKALKELDFSLDLPRIISQLMTAVDIIEEQSDGDWSLSEKDYLGVEVTTIREAAKDLDLINEALYGDGKAPKTESSSG